MTLYSRIGAVFKTAATSWMDDKAARLGAALSYYSVFSLGPLIIIVLAVAGWFLGESAAEGELYRQLNGLFGENGAKAIQAIVAGSKERTTGGIAAAASIGALLIGATAVIVQLKDALNSIWQVRPKPGRTIKTFLKTYIVSLASLMGLGFMLMTSLILTTVLSVMGQYFGSVLPISEGVLQVANFVVSFAVISLLFALMFKFLPDIKIEWRNVWVGAIGTALFFTLGKQALGIYLGRQEYDSTYGAASSLIVILLWVYYLSQILFFGAEFTKAYTHIFGPKEKPAEDAEAISAQKRAKEGLEPSPSSTRHMVPS